MAKDVLATFADEAHRASLESQGLAAVRYVDSQGAPTERYPLIGGLAADWQTFQNRNVLDLWCD